MHILFFIICCVLSYSSNNTLSCICFFSQFLKVILYSLKSTMQQVLHIGHINSFDCLYKFLIGLEGTLSNTCKELFIFFSLIKILISLLIALI